MARASTALSLHEMTHSTGSESRLNKWQGGEVPGDKGLHGREDWLRETGSRSCLSAERHT